MNQLNMFSEYEFPTELSFIQQMNDEDRFCYLDQDFCNPLPTHFNEEMFRLPSTEAESHSMINSDLTREEETLNEMPLLKKQITVSAQPDEGDILAGLALDSPAPADPRSAICSNPQHKECQAFLNRVFGTQERSARGRKAKS